MEWTTGKYAKMQIEMNGEAKRAQNSKSRILFHNMENRPLEPVS
jgi:hypothetical protein